MAQSGISQHDVPILEHKAALALQAARLYGIRSFADIGACYGVNGAYSFYLLDNVPEIKQSYIIDGVVTQATRERAATYPNAQLITGLFNDPSFIEKTPNVDAVIMYDILLHQVDLNWDEFLTAWSKKTRVFVIYNQMWTMHPHTVRFIEFGKDWYQKWVMCPRSEVLDRWFELHDVADPETGRLQKDLFNYWQWGITKDDLVAHVESLGFKLQFMQDYGPVTPRFPWIPCQGFIFAKP